MRGSAEGSVESKRRIRPSMGWALRDLGKETEKVVAFTG
jgi:3-methyladenine DNA glycosylase AlkD